MYHTAKIQNISFYTTCTCKCNCNNNTYKYLEGCEAYINDNVAKILKNYKNCSSNGCETVIDKPINTEIAVANKNALKRIAGRLSDDGAHAPNASNRTSKNDCCKQNVFNKQAVDNLPLNGNESPKVVKTDRYNSCFKSDCEIGDSCLCHDLRLIRDRDVKLFNELEDLIGFLSRAYSGKYHNSPLEPKNVCYNKTYGSGANMSNVANYLARYLSESDHHTGEDGKVYNAVDLNKMIHYILFEKVNRTING